MEGDLAGGNWPKSTGLVVTNKKEDEEIA